jgi:hypothetical protein
VDVVNPPVGTRVDVMAIASRFNLDLRTPTGVVIVRNAAVQPGGAYRLTRRYSTNFIWSPITGLDLVTALLTGIRVNKNEHRERASQIQIGSTFRF